jgi:phosphoesterase RecJ-like protein
MQYSATPGTLRYRGLALNNLEIIAGDQAGLITLSFAELEAAGINPNDSEGVSLSSDLLYVKDWLVGASLVEKEPGRIRLSLRSKDASRADVSKVAVVLGGGGHGPAAGGLLLMPLAEAKRRLVAELEKVIGQ